MAGRDHCAVGCVRALLGRWTHGGKDVTLRGPVLIRNADIDAIRPGIQMLAGLRLLLTQQPGSRERHKPPTARTAGPGGESAEQDTPPRGTNHRFFGGSLGAFPVP